MPYAATFTAEQAALLTLGLIPKAMEDKWFIYFEDPCLYLQRSWTGQPVYKITLSLESGQMKVLEALCSKEVAEVPGADVEYQARLVGFLISNLLLREHKPFPLPAGIPNLPRGLYQHHVAGTGYPETTAPPTRRWWQRW